MMSYESPIRVIEKDLTTRFEDNVMRVVKSYEINVDKIELLKALKNDRKQYDKGYYDGKNDRLNTGTKPFKSGNRWFCGECASALGRFWRYCQHCGQRIDWSEVTDESDC